MSMDRVNGFSWPGLVHPLGAGKAMHSASVGFGRDVVYFPGNGCGIEDFGLVAAGLADEYRVTGVHVPGREPVLWPDEPVDMVTELPGLVGKVLAGAGVGRHVAVGHSMGGMLALQHARVSSEREFKGGNQVIGLVLIEGFVSLETHFAQIRRESYRAVSMTPEVEAAWQARQAAHVAWNKLRPTFFKEFWHSQERHDARGWVGGLNLPILHITAANPAGNLPAEEDVGAWRQRLEMKGVEDLEVCVVPEAGHWPMLDQPGVVERRVRRFLKRVI
jgi:pimeloyl-ACP methyl ester carboxylesterase